MVFLNTSYINDKTIFMDFNRIIELPHFPVSIQLSWYFNSHIILWDHIMMAENKASLSAEQETPSQDSRWIQNHRMAWAARKLKHHLLPIPLRAGLMVIKPHIRLGCPGHHPAQPWIPLGRNITELLRAACSSTSESSQWSIYTWHLIQICPLSV